MEIQRLCCTRVCGSSWSLNGLTVIQRFRVFVDKKDGGERKSTSDRRHSSHGSAVSSRRHSGGHRTDRTDRKGSEKRDDKKEHKKDGSSSSSNDKKDGDRKDSKKEKDILSFDKIKVRNDVEQVFKSKWKGLPADDYWTLT